MCLDYLKPLTVYFAQQLIVPCTTNCDLCWEKTVIVWATFVFLRLICLYPIYILMILVSHYIFNIGYDSSFLLFGLFTSLNFKPFIYTYIYCLTWAWFIFLLLCENLISFYIPNICYCLFIYPQFHLFVTGLRISSSSVYYWMYIIPHSKTGLLIEQTKPIRHLQSYSFVY